MGRVFTITALLFVEGLLSQRLLGTIMLCESEHQQGLEGGNSIDLISLWELHKY